MGFRLRNRKDFIYEPSDFIDAIDQADTIIEADKTESEKSDTESMSEQERWQKGLD